MLFIEPLDSNNTSKHKKKMKKKRKKRKEEADVTTMQDVTIKVTWYLVCVNEQSSKWTSCRAGRVFVTKRFPLKIFLWILFLLPKMRLFRKKMQRRYLTRVFTSFRVILSFHVEWSPNKKCYSSSSLLMFFLLLSNDTCDKRGAL